MIYKKQIESYIPTCDQERVDKKVIYQYIKQYPHNVLLRSNEVAHITSSGFIMNKDLTKALVIYHKIYQAWGWTGGHADGDEDLLEIAIKEAKEETGLKKVKPLKKQMMSIDILPVWGHIKRGNYVTAHLHLNASYVLIADEEEHLIVNEEETGGLKWINADDIENYSTEPDLVVVYKKLIKAARLYDPSKEITVTTKNELKDNEKDGAEVLKDTVVQIAVHEAKSAFYKIKLVKEVAVRSGKSAGKILNKMRNKLKK